MMKLSISKGISIGISCGLVATVLLISANSAMADQRHYQQNNQQYRNNHHQYQNQNQHKNQYQHGGKRVEVTKEVTENGVIIHKTMTNANGVTYTIDKVIEKGPHGHVDIDKKINGRTVEHHSH